MTTSELVPVLDRDTWLEERKQAIGASDAPALFGLSPYTTEHELWMEKTNRLEPWKGSESTKAGQRFENAVLDYAEEDLGKLTRNVRKMHATLPLAATMDAVTASGQPVEAKTTGVVGPIIGDWGDKLTDQVPEHYLIQVQVQLFVTGAELAYLYALIGGRGVVPYVVQRSQSLGEYIGNYVADWWDRHIVRDVPPPVKDISLEMVRRIRREKGKTIELASDMVALLAELEQAKAVAKDANETVDRLQAAVIFALEDADAALLPDGSMITYYEQSRKGYTVEPCTFRTLRTKRAKK